MSEIKNVLIAGVLGGYLGSAIVQEFVSYGKFNVFIASRHDSKSTFPATVKVLKTDYTPASLKALFEGQPVDAVICNLTTEAVGSTQIALIDASKAAGVKRYFPSEFGIDTKNPKNLDIVPILGEKVAAENYLKKVQSDTFTWTAIVTGPFFDWGLETGFLPVNIKEKHFDKWDNGKALFSTTNLATIGKALVSVLGSPAYLSSTANKPIYIASYTITLNELFATVQKYSVGSWKVEEIDSDIAISKAKKDFADGNYNGGIVLLKASVWSKAGLGDYRGKGLSNEALGLPVEDLEADVKRIVSQMAGKKYL